MKTLRFIFFALALVSSVKAQQTRPLKQYYSDERKDFFATATDKGASDAAGSGYEFNADEGFVSTINGSDKIELLLFWNGTEGDNAVATIAEKSELERMGYVQVRSEGFIWRNAQAGRLALKLYYSATNKDYTLVSSSEGENYLNNQGYRFVKNIGFVQITQGEDSAPATNTPTNKPVFTPTFTPVISIQIEPKGDAPINTPNNGNRIERTRSNAAGDPKPIGDESISTEGAQFCTSQRLSITQSDPNVFIMGNTNNTFYPGSIYYANSVQIGQNRQFIIQRPPAQFTIDLASGSNINSLTTNVNNLNLGSYNESLAILMRQSNATIGANEVSLKFEQYSEEKQMAIGLGLMFNGFGADVKAKLNINNGSTKNTVVAMYVQKYFTVNYVKDNVNNPIVFEMPANASELVYVESVSYGRIGFLKIESNLSYDSLKFALEASYAGSGYTAGVGVDTKVKSIIKQCSFSSYFYGGTSENTEVGSGDDFLNRFFSNFNRTTYNPNVAAKPVAMKFNFLNNNDQAYVTNTAEYTKRECTVAKKLRLKFLGIGVAEAQTGGASYSTDDCRYVSGYVNAELKAVNKTTQAETRVPVMRDGVAQSELVNMWALNAGANQFEKLGQTLNTTNFSSTAPLGVFDYNVNGNLLKNNDLKLVISFILFGKHKDNDFSRQGNLSTSSLITIPPISIDVNNMPPNDPANPGKGNLNSLIGTYDTNNNDRRHTYKLFFNVEPTK